MNQIPSNAFAIAIMQNSDMTKLNLSGQIESEEDRHSAIIGLKNNKTIKEIDLSSNYFTDDNAHELARSIRGNEAITSVNLSDNILTDDGAQSLLDAIPHAPNLVKLDLTDNFDCHYKERGVTDEMLRKIEEALAENRAKAVEMAKAGQIALLPLMQALMAMKTQTKVEADLEGSSLVAALA
jgi:Ran GTPase-activating protein (RanGAP) involved in mRNA processing and transport